MRTPQPAPVAEPERTVAFQGLPGAYSHLACIEAVPDMIPLPCAAFDDAFAAVSEGRARYGMIPIENSLAGRVADIHHLLPDSGLYIVAEHFHRVQHQLLGLAGAPIERITRVHSHIHALSQCRGFLRRHAFMPTVHADTAGAAAEVAERGDPAEAAIASTLAAEIYQLEILKSDIEDAEHNTTRFVLLSKRQERPEIGSAPCMTSLVFRVRNVPAAIFKAMGGFATNGVNMVKLESYQLGGSFAATQFYADVEGHPDEPSVARALDELQYFSSHVKVLGVYPAHPARAETLGG
ncbi:MAG: prephenate dehydratase [Proteobacteria bacterium]|nr:prephenate dehydratase [Pseudomonadota bacterium]